MKIQHYINTLEIRYTSSHNVMLIEIHIPKHKPSKRFTKDNWHLRWFKGA